MKEYEIVGCSKYRNSVMWITAKVLQTLVVEDVEQERDCLVGIVWIDDIIGNGRSIDKSEISTTINKLIKEVFWTTELRD